MKMNRSRATACASTGRAVRVPSKMTADEAAALRAYRGTPHLVACERGLLRCVAYLTTEQVAALRADDYAGGGIRYVGEANQVLARGRALRNAADIYLQLVESGRLSVSWTRGIEVRPAGVNGGVS